MLAQSFGRTRRSLRGLVEWCWQVVNIGGRMSRDGSKISVNWWNFYIIDDMISVANLNRAFPKYPITMEDKSWIYGVWYCGTSWTKIILHGQYPPGFLKRALALFPQAKDILHCPSGTIE